jgi:hypothetical protein
MANLNLSQFTEKTLVADADWVFVWDTAGSISKKVSRNSLLNSGTLAGASAPITVSQTWNDAAVAFKAFVVNAAGSSAANSASGSLLLDLQVGTVTQFNVTKAGVITLNDSFSLRSNGGWLELGGKANVLAGTSKIAIWSGDSGLVQLANNAVFSWSSLSSAANGSTDLILARDSANTLALRNGITPQTFNVYGTFTTAITNFERLAIKYNGSDLAYQIAAEKGSTNGDYRPLQFWTGGAKRLIISEAGAIIQRPLASVTPSDNGDLVVEATSNSLLTFKFKGSDGTVRSGTIALV